VRGAALHPPSWIVPYKALSLSPPRPPRSRAHGWTRRRTPPDHDAQLKGPSGFGSALLKRGGGALGGGHITLSKRGSIREHPSDTRISIQEETTRDGNSTRDSFVPGMKKRIHRAEDLFSSGTGIHSTLSSARCRSVFSDRTPFRKGYVPVNWCEKRTDITSKGLRDSAEERGEPQRFKFLCQCVVDTSTQVFIRQPNLSRHFTSMTQDGLHIADTLGGGRRRNGWMV
jgi:hypothetical protein